MEFTSEDLNRWLADWKRIWPTSVQLERWLDDRFDPPWPHDVRRERDDSGRTIWTVPDYDRGRSRSLAVDREVLHDFDSSDIIRALEEEQWLSRIETDDLLVVHGATGRIEPGSCTSK